MTIVNARVADNGHLIIVDEDGSVVDAGNVRGMPGPQGEKGVGTKGDPGEPGGVIVSNGGDAGLPAGFFPLAYNPTTGEFIYYTQS